MSHESQRFSPERVCVADGLGATQLGVQVVVGASHLAHSYPVLALERQPQGAPAQVGWHVQNEAGHVGQLDATDVPVRRAEVGGRELLWRWMDAGTQEVDGILSNLILGPVCEI